MTAPSETRSGSRCEFKAYHSYPNREGKLKVKQILDPFNSEFGHGDDGGYALIINRTFTVENQTAPSTVTLRINSPQLLKAFHDVIGSYPTVPSDFKSPFELSNPFQMLVHYWDELDRHRAETEDTEARMHMNLLFEFMDHEVGPDRQKMVAMLGKEQITYFTAWAIFRPGDLLYTKVMGHEWLLKCGKTVYEESTSRGPYLEVHCTYTDHDGESEGQAAHKIVLYQKRQFGAENPAFVRELPIYPRRFVQDEGLEDRLKRRGRKFLDHRATSVESYDGLAQYLKEPPVSWWRWDMDEYDPVWMPYTETGRIVLDKATFQQDFNSKGVSIKKAEPEPLLCPPFALGYSLSRKDWCRFLIANVGPAEWKGDAWESLILEEEQKLVLQALVTSHRYPDNPRDQPEQKGKGLVILLYGAPGSGKTLTAEASAELTQRALVSTSMGSLNRENRAWIFEFNLRRLLQYATQWKAIVLLDEADVFLETRDERAGDAERTALVAVFLRELEYFSGVVFLTTNRLRSFDQAMKSRVHLALEYAPPELDTRRQVWRQCLDAVPAADAEPDIAVEVSSPSSPLVDRALNGREISNAVNTARTIALFEGRRLNLEHIRKVLKVRDTFDRSLREKRMVMMSTSTSETGGGGSGRLPGRGSILFEEPQQE